ncbi:unnamed protein product [marine sediment metagenome]|uniref:MAGE domain-containing protein n=1 Tax=marine sediment metagenome TaxID=412755 RepID=X0VBV8_9ZZZZ
MMRVNMESMTFEEVVKNITKIVLTSPQKMIREEDLRIISKDFEFEEIISAVYLNLKNIGFEFIKSKFLDQIYYVLTSEGKDDSITPSQYGTLAMILALSKEIDENLEINDLEEIFKVVWTSDVEFLIRNDYLRRFEDQNILRITPLGKALLKNILQDLDLKKLLEAFTAKNQADKL